LEHEWAKESPCSHLDVGLAEEPGSILSHVYAELDGLIVTGTEPKAANFVDEPYWAAFSQLVDWASHI
jgi:homoserine trans-succinylase